LADMTQQVIGGGIGRNPTTARNFLRTAGFERVFGEFLLQGFFVSNDGLSQTVDTEIFEPHGYVRHSKDLFG